MMTMLIGDDDDHRRSCQ